MIKEYSLQILEELKERIETFDDAQLVRAADMIDAAPAVYFAGMGRSRLFIMSFCMRLMHLGLKCYMVGDVTTPAIQKGDLLVIGSGSGETESLVAMARKAKGLGIDILLFTSAKESSLASLADCIFRIDGPSSKLKEQSQVKSIQPMGSLFEQGCLFAYEGIMVYLMHKHHTNGDEMFKRHANLE